MKTSNILLIISIVLTSLGLSLIFIQTEIAMTLLGVIMMAVGVLTFMLYTVYRGNTKPSK